MIKLLVKEQETDALSAFLSSPGHWLTSRVAAVEVPRALMRVGVTAAVDLATLWGSVSFRELDEEVVRRAASIEPASVRALDAIHVASALLARPELDAFVTYDSRMADAARLHGLPLVAPA